MDRSSWDATHDRRATPVFDALLRETLLGALPEGLKVTTLWPAWPLDRVAGELQVAPGERVADLACGQGAIGHWVAAATATSVVGVDLSLAGIGRAAATAVAKGVTASYVQARLEATGLRTASVDAVLVVDALHFVDDVAGLTEIARIVRPGRRVVVVGSALDPDRRRRAWVGAGLEVVVQEETVDWRARFRRFLALAQERIDDLRPELGDAAVDRLRGPGDEAIDRAWHGLTVAVRPR